MKSRLMLLYGIVLLFCGCSSWNPLAVRSQSPEGDGAALSEKKVGPRLVGDLAVPFGMHAVKIEAIGLVTGLKGTGSDPNPSPQRVALLAEMQARGVVKPNRVLASPNTALVLVRGVLRPGVQKGDKFDLEVRVPGRSATTSLRGGWLMMTRLKEMRVLGRQIHDGHSLAVAEGPIMVDPSQGKNDKVLACRGRVLGGGRSLIARNMGLMIKPEYQNVLNSSRIANAINKRFHSFESGLKVGAATAKTDKYVELLLHPRYKDNVQRYIKIVRACVMRETESEMVQRLVILEKQLLDPITAGRAARELEAIGKPAIEVLTKGTESDDPEISFYSAESLAYLDQREAAVPLAKAARHQPAFRVFALTALSTMNDYAAYEQLCLLLNVPSAETRYGAFRALWTMNRNDPLVMGESLGDQFGYHVLDTKDAPMVHITRNRRPELVLFGKDQKLQLPLAVEAGNQIMVTGLPTGEISVAKFAVGKADQKRVVSTHVDNVIRAIVELGGTYPDVVQALQQAKACGALNSRLEVDALPKAGRIYSRVSKNDAKDPDSEASNDSTGPQRLLLGNPLPNLFLTSSEKQNAKK